MSLMKDEKRRYTLYDKLFLDYVHRPVPVYTFKCLLADRVLFGLVFFLLFSTLQHSFDRGEQNTLQMVMFLVHSP